MTSRAYWNTLLLITQFRKNRRLVRFCSQFLIFDDLTLTFCDDLF